MDSPSSYNKVATTSSVVSLQAFYAISWTVFALCLLAFATRIYIRLHCFRRFLADDWVMLFALVLLLSATILGQVSMKDVYAVIDWQNGRLIPDASFQKTYENALHSFGAALTISLVGILAVKVNFLLFFKRLGTQLTAFNVFWYVVLFITVTCGIVNIGLMDYKCVFASLPYIMEHCTSRSVLSRFFNFQKISVTLDVMTDALIIIFPAVVLWNVKINLRKKVILTCMFGLVTLTIGVTIVRGSIFGGTYKKFDSRINTVLNMSWMWLWIYLEFAVAFLIACIISFRALFAQRENRSYENQAQLRRFAWQEQQASSTSKRLETITSLRRAKNFHDRILRSFRESETMDDDQLPQPESGRFSPTFLSEIQTSYNGKETPEKVHSNNN